MKSSTTSHAASSSNDTINSSAVSPIISRIDPPHALGDEPVAAPAAEAVPAESPPTADVLATAGRSNEHLAEQLQTQALQLAGHLRSKQREIDRREALLNSREAKLDNELRIARLWTRERNQDQAERDQQFAQVRRELDDKAAQIAAAELSADHDCSTIESQLDLRQRELKEKACRLETEQQALRVAEERLEQQRARFTTDHQQAEQRLAIWQAESEQNLARQLRNIEQAQQALTLREEQLAAKQMAQAKAQTHSDQEARYAARQAGLEQAESLLNKHAHDLDQERKRLAVQRDEQQLEAKQQRQELAAWQQRERAEWAAKKEQLDVATEVLEKHRVAVEQMRCEAAKMHREALEMRLISEQLWLELSQHAPAAELTQSLATLRKRLAENYRGAKEHVAEQKAELVRLAERLDEQQARLHEHREQVRAWQAAQQQEIEQHAARLVQREIELDRQEKTQQLESTRWNHERRELQQEIRRLHSRVRELEGQDASV